MELALLQNNGVVEGHVNKLKLIKRMGDGRAGFPFLRRAEWEETLQAGIYRACQGVHFTDAYFAHPAEIRPFMQRQGFEILDLLGCEGIIATNEAQIIGSRVMHGRSGSM